MAESSASLSFKFSKTSKKRLIVKNDEKDDEETEFSRTSTKRILISSVSRQGFKDAEGPTKEKKLIIPALENKLKFPNAKNDADYEAKRVLLEEAKRFGEKREQETQEIAAIPMQQSTSMDKEKLDLSQFSDAPEEADYETVPVDAFGKALLRGMGWKEGDAIGRSGKKPIAPITTTPRPSRLGLGAEIKPPPEPTPNSSKK